MLSLLVETKGKIKEKDLLEIVVAGEQNSLHPIALAICSYYGKKSKLKVANYHEIVGKGIEFEIKKDKYFVGRSLNSKGFTQVDVLKNDKLIGSIYLQDEVKNNSAKSIERLKSLGVKTMMLTGDSKTIAKKVSNELEIDINKFCPIDSKGIKHELGVFDHDAFYKEFITQRCKKICIYR